MDKGKHLHLVVNNTGVQIEGERVEVPNLDHLLKSDYLEWEEEQYLTDFDIQYTAPKITVDGIVGERGTFRKIIVFTGMSILLGYIFSWIVGIPFMGWIAGVVHTVQAIYAGYRLLLLYPSKKKIDYKVSIQEAMDIGDYSFIVKALQEGRAFFTICEDTTLKVYTGDTLADRVYISLTLKEEGVPWWVVLYFRPRGISSFMDTFYDYDDSIEIPVRQLDSYVIQYQAVIDNDDDDPDGVPVPLSVFD